MFRMLFIVALIGLLLSPTAATASPKQQPAGGGWTVQDGDLIIEFTPDGASTLLSASGCNADVCIFLTGSGLTVDRWRTTGYVTSNECSRARFWANGNLVKASSLYCPSTSGTLSATWESPGRFSNGTLACNSWLNVTGYPCKTISS